MLQINLWGETLHCCWHGNLAFVVVVTNLHACPRSLSSFLFISSIPRVAERQQNSLSSAEIRAFFHPCLTLYLCWHRQTVSTTSIVTSFLLVSCPPPSRSLQTFTFPLINTLRKVLTGVCVCFSLEVTFWDWFRGSKNLFVTITWIFHTWYNCLVWVFYSKLPCSHSSCWLESHPAIPFHGGLQEFMLVMTLNARFPHIFASTNNQNSPLAGNLIQLSCTPQ